MNGGFDLVVHRIHLDGEFVNSIDGLFQKRQVFRVFNSGDCTPSYQTYLPDGMALHFGIVFHEDGCKCSQSASTY